MPHKDPQKRHEYFQRYYAKNRAKRLSTEKHRYWNNREKILAYWKQFRSEHAEILRERKRAYHRRHAKAIQKKVLEWQRKNPERAKEIHKRYTQRYAKTPEGKAKNLRGLAKRRARFDSVVCSLTAQEWLDICESFSYRCAYCGKQNLSLTQDHYMPLSKGGHHIKDNIVPACKSCNSRKHTKHPHRLL